MSGTEFRGLTLKNFLWNLALKWKVVGAAPLGAFCATVSNAVVTVLCLLCARGQDWSPDFVRIISVVGMLSGWFNSLLFFYGPRLSLQLRRFLGPLAWVLSFVGTVLVLQTLFQQQLTLQDMAYTIGALSPLLLAPLFGVEFAESNYPWVYTRVIGLNAALAVPAFFGILLGPAPLFWGTGLVGLLVALYSFFRALPQPPAMQDSLWSARPWLNPACPVLERAVWDQWVLSQFSAGRLSLPVYVVGKAITFFGNVAYSFLLGRLTREGTKAKGHKALPIALFCFGLLLSIACWITPYAAVLLGQFLAWASTATLTMHYGLERSNRYFWIIFLWVFDFAFRLWGISSVHTFEVYARWISVSSIPFLLSLSLVWWLLTRTHQSKTKMMDPLPS